MLTGQQARMSLADDIDELREEITSAPWPHVGAAVLQVQECGPASS